MSRILIVSAIHRKLDFRLQCRAMGLAHRMIASTPEHEFGLWLDFREAEKREETHCQRVCRVADDALKAVDLSQWDYVLWVDADVVDYSPHLCSRFINLNPTGITAPLPLIEGSERLYDTLGCIDVNGRHLGHDAPYWETEQQDRLVPMRCVGMLFLCPAYVLQFTGVPDCGEEVPGWWAACDFARHKKLPVFIDRETVALHANLPAHGHEWH
jgi:hypothetical protein